MENTSQLNNSMDDIVFAGRNQSYGGYAIRKLYDKHMSRAMLSGIVFFLLAICSPYIVRLVSGFLPDETEELVMKEVTLAEPPPIDPKKPPPPPPPKVEPPPIKDQIKFVPPIVKKDEEVQEEEPPPPTIEELKDVVIATETKKGEEDGVDESLIEDEPPPQAAEIGEGEVEEKPFLVVEQMPEYPDGMEAMLKYIYAQVKYPAIARENGIAGTVVLRFVVSKTGELQDIKVVRGIGGGCDEEAMRVVRGMPKWKPGKQGGRAVPVQFTLPIKFTLR